MMEGFFNLPKKTKCSLDRASLFLEKSHQKDPEELGTQSFQIL